MGSEVPFPFQLVESRLAVAGPRAKRPSHAVALLEQWGVPSRLASNAGIAGAHRGYITDLARDALHAMTPSRAWGDASVRVRPHADAEGRAKLARDFELPRQVALEKYMACGIGGCAGCTVLLQTSEGPAMKRVCVDGPVFDARQVYP